MPKRVSRKPALCIDNFHNQTTETQPDKDLDYNTMGKIGSPPSQRLQK